jgi:class 3 adenylate cyclase
MSKVSPETMVADLERKLEASHEQQRAISDVLRAVATSEGLQAVLDEIVAAAKTLCRGEHAQLYLAEGDYLQIFSQSFDLSEAYDYARGHPHARDRTTIVGRVALSGQVEQIADVLTDSEYSYEAQAIVGYRALLGVPIMLDDELIGAIAIGRNDPGLFSDEHVELVKTFADQAAIALANARLIETVERQRAELARFISPQVADLISSEDGKHLLAGHRALITIAYFDLRGFTAFAETAEPEELIDIVREYHAVAGELVEAHSGTLEHFAGDGIMVFFNDPVPLDEPELQAAKLALAMRDRIGECAERWRKRGYALGLGAGISVGYATLGRIGFEGRYDYGALGSVTNVAARLSDEAAPGQILLSQRAHAALEDKVEAKLVLELQLKGLARPMEVYELMALAAGGP